MYYVCLSIIAFVSTIAVHIAYCRRASKTQMHAKAFILMSIGFLIVYILAVHYAPADVLFLPSVWTLPFKFTGGVMFFLMIPVYLTFYTLTQLMSPSKKILICISRKGSVTYPDIVAAIQEEEFINTRLNDLILSGCVFKTEGRYALSGSGKRIADILNVMQLMLGRDMGG